MINTAINRINRSQIFIGFAGLIAGLLVYLVNRPPEEIYLIYGITKISLYNILPDFFGIFGNYFPAFIHIFSFILITAGLLCCQKKGYLIICLSWFLVDCGFEVGQRFNTAVLRIIPDWFRGIPFLENTENYFLHGTFDAIDIVAIAFGTIISYLILLATNAKKGR